MSLCKGGILIAAPLFSHFRGSRMETEPFLYDIVLERDKMIFQYMNDQ
jgi:hypothetical protein